MNTRESDFWNERSGPRIAPEHFGDIVATAADLAIVLTSNGTILTITSNPLNSAMGQMGHWEGRKITDFLAPDSQEKVLRQIRAVDSDASNRPESIEVNHIDGAVWDFPVRYTLHKTGRDGRILMLGRDMRPVAELQQRLVRAQLALEKDYESQRVFETRYRVLLEAAREPLVLVDVTSGRILDLNATAARAMGGAKTGLVGAAFTAEFEGRRRAEFIEELCKAAADDSVANVTAPLRRSTATVAIAPILFRNAGERVLLCRLVEEGAAADRIPQGEPLTERLVDLYRNAREGIVFTNADNQIVQANDAFLSMMDMDAVADLRGRSFADFLSRGGVDLKMVSDEAQVSAYATRLITAYGSQVPVEVSMAPMGDEAGHGYVIRETGSSGLMREETASGTPGTGAGAGDPTALANALSLVGAAPLRDIVASMTDVVEKQCIETAVELTDNNRVAAAEMLGLSRQSLYVKLRKYGLLQRNEP